MAERGSSFLVDDFVGPEGGSEQHLLFLQRELPQESLELHFGVLTRLQRIDPADFPVRPVMFNETGTGRGTLWVAAARRLGQLVDYIKTHEIDIVHAFFLTSELYACLAARWAGRHPGGTRVLGVRRNIGYWHTWRSRWLARFASFLGADYAANCQAAAEFSAKAEWIPRRRITVIPNPAPVARLRDGLAHLASRESLGIAADEKIVGMVATVRPIKDYATFLQAARRVLDEHPRTRFLVIGTEEPGYKTEMVRLTEKLGIDGRVAWLGPMPNPLEVVPLFDVAVLSSRSEAMPNAVLEYMAAGVAVVATDVGGTRELIGPDLSEACLVPPARPDLLASRVAGLLGNDALRQEIGRAAKVRAETAFSQERILAEYAALYDRLAAGAVRR